MSAILPLHALIINQAHVGLIYQGRRLQAVTRALAPHVAACQAVELVINDGSQPFQRRLVAVAPGAKKRTDVVPFLFHALQCLSLNYSRARVIVSEPPLRLSGVEAHMKLIVTSIAASSLLAAIALGQA